MPQKRATRRKKAAPASQGLAPAETKAASTAATEELERQVEADGGAVLGNYREPFGGRPVLLAALPVAKVEPTPYQRNASDAHVKRLMNVIEKVGLFLDPIVVIRHDGAYWTPNGNHRLQALKKLGARTVTALVVPEPEVAFKIIALNTEKAHNLREKALEAIRMARAIAEQGDAKESAFAFEFEEASYLTLGLCYEERPRFSGGAYQPVLKRVDSFLDLPMKRALAERGKRSERILELDGVVNEVVEKLKARGLTSPYLKAFVAARINPIRFSKSTEFDFDDVFGKMLASARKFNAEKIRQADLAKMGGPPPEAD